MKVLGISLKCYFVVLLQCFHPWFLKILFLDCQVITQVESETLSQKTEVATQPDGEDIDDTLQFDEGQVDMVHYKRDVSWVVLDEFAEPNGEGTLVLISLALLAN